MLVRDIAIIFQTTFRLFVSPRGVQLAFVSVPKGSFSLVLILLSLFRPMVKVTCWRLILFNWACAHFVMWAPTLILMDLDHNFSCLGL